MTSSNISERYKEMLDLISLKQLATELRSKCAREEQHQITEASMLRLIRKKYSIHFYEPCKIFNTSGC